MQKTKPSKGRPSNIDKSAEKLPKVKTEEKT